MSISNVHIQEPSFGAEESEVYGDALDAPNRSGIRYMLGGTLALSVALPVLAQTGFEKPYHVVEV